MRGQLRRLRGWLGRVIRDIERKALPGSLTGPLAHRLALAKRLHAQQRDSKNKLYALHAPEAECIAKGKARTPFEFGVKVSVAVTATEGLVVGMRSMPGNPYDGHTLDSALEQVSILTDSVPSIVLADRGYRGVAPNNPATRLILSHTRKLPPELKRLLKRRQVVEPMIGHMKSDGLLGRNWLKGEIGDALHAVMCGAGHNLRMILARLRALYCALLAWLAAATMEVTEGQIQRHGIATA
jgi:IS5 family transposase